MTDGESEMCSNYSVVGTVTLREKGRMLLICLVDPCVDSAKLMGFETQTKTEGAVREL